jgi:ABC-type antimicrobial peptide transport system, ATPase component
MVVLKDIVKTYHPGQSNAFEALRGASLEIQAGEMVAIMGTSGAGKSTLLHILACIDRYDAGEYLLDGTLLDDFSEKKLAELRNEKIGMVMQDFALIENFSVLENVSIPLDFSKKRLRGKEKAALVRQAVSSTGIKDQMHKKVKELSGGQKQRAAIARAIINNPSLILADEPTGALDSKTTEEIMHVFTDLNEKGKTIVIVTHDAEVANQCQRIIRIEDGRVL